MSAVMETWLVDLKNRLNLLFMEVELAKLHARGEYF